MTERGVVLVVASDAELRAGIGSQLEAQGFGVMACPGPTAPEYTCVGDRRGRCPLAEAADAVVLDGWLESDEALDGVPSEELLALYLASGVPVAVLRHPGQRVERGSRGAASGIVNEIGVALQGGSVAASSGLVVDLLEPEIPRLGQDAAPESD
jgi:hypothetical protein